MQSLSRAVDPNKLRENDLQCIAYFEGSANRQQYAQWEAMLKQMKGKVDMKKRDDKGKGRGKDREGW